MPKSKCKTDSLKLKSLLIFLVFIFYIFSFKFDSVFAQYRLPKGNLNTTVSGTLGDFYLNLSGYIAPFASIVLTSENIYLRATTADNKGYFRITEVLIKKGFSKFCFDAYDFRRLGESYSCTTIPPATSSTTIEDIFLPPTLGLSRSKIAAGESTTAFGYSMPGATVTLNFQGRNIATRADKTGYYQFVLNNVQAGVYELTARAKLADKESLPPEKKVILKSLSKTDQAVGWLEDLLRKLWEIITTYWFIWIVVPTIILIIILLWMIRRLHRHHNLHHMYFVGY